MKGYNKCLSCGKVTINKKYCDDKCKHKWYYHNKEGAREKKIESVLKRRKIKKELNSLEIDKK
jgi:replication-associated recombination protein RarA